MSIEIHRPWARLQTVESGEAAGFVTLTNRGSEPDRLVAATCALAAKTEIWGIKVVGAELRMLPLEKGVFLEVGMAVELKPRGYHLFFQGLKQPLVRGQKVPVTLTFAKAGTCEVELVVEAEGAINRDTLGMAT
ncbi:MAG: copper chaperone PCu(A)C [Proteobacteria bacterium]|nr:copper chaperone PCu(A)C [Pseudomonadota bacterium]